MVDRNIPAAGVEENALDWFLARRDTCVWSCVSCLLSNGWDVAGLETSKTERACSRATGTGAECGGSLQPASKEASS